MKKTHQFTLVLMLGLLLALVPIPDGGLAQPVSARTYPAGVQSPILDPFINIWVDTVDNREPAVAYNSNHDEYLVVWYNEQDGGTLDIYARRVRGDGTLLSSFLVVSDVGKDNWQPDVAYSPTQDEYLIVYTYEYDSNSNDYDIWARLVKWDGSDLGAPRYVEFPINQDSDLQWNPAVAYNSQNNEYLVVYENWWAGGLRDIAAQRVDKDGTAPGGPSGANIATGAGGGRFSPDVAYNEARNEYLIAYTFDVGSNGQTYGKVASANLGTLSSEIHICDDLYDQDYPAVAAGPDEYLVTWVDGTWGSNDCDIFARRVSGAGTPQGAAGGFEIAGSGDNNPHVFPAVAYGAGYGYLVACRRFNLDLGASGLDVYGRYVMRGQNEASGDEFAIDNGSDFQDNPAIACAPSGDCLVVEEDHWPGPDYEIRGRFVRPYHIYVPLVSRNL